MKGVIFNLAEEIITDAYGEDAWDELLDAADLEGAYTSVGSYPDEDLFRIVEAAAAKLGTSGTAVVRSLGEGALPLLAERYPFFFAEHATTRSFLLTLNDIIHSEVRKLYPGAVVPEFVFDATDPDCLVMTYRSPRKLCGLAEGFIVGAARHFGEEALLDHPVCMLRGDDRCEIRCRFLRTAA